MLDIQLVRIDDRLIHGQVAVVWTKETKVERILVVSDEVARDNLRKTLLQQAAPPNIKAHVIPVDKLLDVNRDPRFAGVKTMLLFTNPHDVWRVVRQGLSLKTINIGGMKFTSGKKMITNFVSVDQQDVTDFQYLHDHGLDLEIRKVPADKKVDLMELLKKEKMLA
ncbi:PTS system, mannose/fructose/sorbose family, IIB component [Enterococcus canis]|uniref:PTS system, mannose/fructose/sorbose family, IIB component n=1 Tax=Enterococcus canis TaxID=214095 RepID=A0A1L8REB4_9ENTE|nr:mannose/fructose/sorbose PTS transporter subunit IIB [Enterococcus canis]OJG18116.1 PTS system, mannose/fructose/sorbose family, IIB component [Enterococcus canis]